MVNRRSFSNVLPMQPPVYLHSTRHRKVITDNDVARDTQRGAASWEGKVSHSVTSCQRVQNSNQHPWIAAQKPINTSNSNEVRNELGGDYGDLKRLDHTQFCYFCHYQLLTVE